MEKICSPVLPRVAVLVIASVGMVLSGVLLITSTEYVVNHGWKADSELFLSSWYEVSLLLHVMLFYGTCKERPQWVLPYIVISLVALVYMNLVVANTLLLGRYKHVSNESDILITSAVTSVTGLIFWFVICNFYKRLVERNRFISDIQNGGCYFPDILEIVNRQYQQLLERLRGPEEDPENSSAEYQNAHNQNIENLIEQGHTDSAF